MKDQQNIEENALYLLRLYIAGKNPRSEESIKNFKSILEDLFKDQYSLEIIDIIENPQLAKYDKILATPTVIKLLLPPIRRLCGYLINKERIVLVLEMIDHK